LLNAVINDTVFACAAVSYWRRTFSKYSFWCSNDCKVQRLQNVSNV